jgi:methionine synthase II (cobalamin-independent)
MASAKLNPPFRAEHLGSLLRPEYLLEARAKYENKEISAEELDKIATKAIQTVIQLQKEAGIKSLSDGEYRFVVF